MNSLRRNSLRSKVAVATIACGIALLGGCSSQDDSTATQAEPSAASTQAANGQPSSGASPQAQASPGQDASTATDSGGGIASDIEEIVLLPFHLVADLVGLIL